MLSSHLFFCLPLLLAPFTVPCRIVFAMPEDLEMWPYYLSFFSLSWLRDHHAHQLHSGFCCEPPRSSHGLCRKSHLKGLDPSLDFYCQGPALTGIRKVDKMSVHISLTLEASEMFLSLQVIFSLERAAVVWAILERILSFDPSLEMITGTWSSPLLLASDLLSWSLFGSHLGCLSSLLSCLGRSPFCTLWWLYRDGLPGRQFLLPLLHSNGFRNI